MPAELLSMPRCEYQDGVFKEHFDLYGLLSNMFEAFKEIKDL